jgi:secreted trypsin-like serine protease
MLFTAWKLMLVGLVAEATAVGNGSSPKQPKQESPKQASSPTHPIHEPHRRGRTSSGTNSKQRSDEPGIASIVGGTEIEVGSMPYLTVTGIGGNNPIYPLCAGTLISPHVVMTSALCNVYYDSDLEEYVWDPPTYVNFGTHNLYEEAGVVTMNLKDTSEGNTGSVLVHPDFSLDAFENDVTLLILPFAMTGIEQIKINLEGSVPESGDVLSVTGWGTTSAGSSTYSDVPLQAIVNYVSYDQCIEPNSGFPEGWILESMMCAAAPGADACNGDIGAPLINEDGVQVGIASWGEGEI